MLLCDVCKKQIEGSPYSMITTKLLEYDDPLGQPVMLRGRFVVMGMDPVSTDSSGRTGYELKDLHLCMDCLHRVYQDSVTNFDVVLQELVTERLESLGRQVDAKAKGD